MRRAKEPASPVHHLSVNTDPSKAVLQICSVNNGLTIREHFAGLAMQGLLSDSTTIQASGERIPIVAVEYADLLLAELAKEPRHE